jgi:serine phosphatase RsbU (regulator of sigma subunit)
MQIMSPQREKVLASINIILNGNNIQEVLMDTPIDKKAIKFFYFKYNFFTEGFSFFVIVPVVLFYVWANIQLTPTQLDLFNKIWPPAFVFGIIFVLVNNWIVLIPVLKYFKKLLKNEPVTDEVYEKAKRRFLKLPIIHAVGAFFRWILLLTNAILPFTLLSDVTRPQTVNMWLGPPVCAIVGVASYFSITEIIVQNILNKGIFTKKIETDVSPRVNLLQQLTAMSISVVLTAIFLLFMLFYITIENYKIANTLMYVRISIFVFISFGASILIALLVNKTIRDRVKIVVEFLKKIGSGDLDGKAQEVAVHDEISEIIFDVDDMKKKLRQSRNELVELNVNLENKVAERTKELASALDEIEAANNELEAMNDSLTNMNRTLEENERVRKKDMALAATVQASFLPKSPPPNSRYDIAFIYKPWSEVSGDFFDFYEDRGDMQGVGLFDVSGHGISSGLLTLLVKSIITRNFHLRKEEKLGKVMEFINEELISEMRQSDNYVTGILLRFEDERVEYVNSASPDVIFKSGASGKVGRVLDKMGDSYVSRFLGVADMKGPISSLTIKLTANDCLFLYTDCMVEAENARGRAFEETGIMASLKNAPGGSARDILRYIINDFNHFLGGTQVRDDLTAILIKRK